MKLVTNRYKSGGLHEEHAVATWNLGNHRIFSARIILSSVASLALPYFSTVPHKRNDFRQQIFEPKKCVLIFSHTFACNISPYYQDELSKMLS